MNTIMQEDFVSILKNDSIDWSSFKNKTVLVTGASGLLPSYMAMTLLYLNELKSDSCINVICMVRKKEAALKKFEHFRDSEFLSIIEHDVSLPIKFNEKIDYIIHAASKASNSYFMSDPVGVINANALGTHNLLTVAKENNVEAFLLFSSGEVYGRIDNLLLVENEETFGRVNTLDIRNCYAESKRMAENMCACWAHQFGINTKIVRISHTYGPTISLDDERVFAYFVSAVLKKQDIVLHSDGSARRPFCYITDATLAFFKILLDGKKGEAYNMCNSYMLSVKELAEIVIEVSNTPSLHVKTIENTKGRGQTSDILRDGPSNEKLRQLGWEPTVSEREGFHRTIMSFLE